MNTINMAIVVLATPALITVGSAQTGKSASTPGAGGSAGAIGRYQLLIGEYETHSNVPVSEKGVFRIDTATGRTSLYMAGNDAQGRYVGYWYQIDESLRRPQ